MLKHFAVCGSLFVQGLFILINLSGLEFRLPHCFSGANKQKVPSVFHPTHHQVMKASALYFQHQIMNDSTLHFRKRSLHFRKIALHFSQRVRHFRKRATSMEQEGVSGGNYAFREQHKEVRCSVLQCVAVRCSVYIMRQISH